MRFKVGDIVKVASIKHPTSYIGRLAVVSEITEYKSRAKPGFGFYYCLRFPGEVRDDCHAWYDDDLEEGLNGIQRALQCLK